MRFLVALFLLAGCSVRSVRQPAQYSATSYPCAHKEERQKIPLTCSLEGSYRGYHRGDIFAIKADIIRPSKGQLVRLSVSHEGNTPVNIYYRLPEERELAHLFSTVGMRYRLEVSSEKPADTGLHKINAVPYRNGAATIALKDGQMRINTISLVEVGGDSATGKLSLELTN